MQEKKPVGGQNEIKLEGLQSQATNVVSLSDKILTTLKEHSMGMETFVGGLLFGTPTKKQTFPDGKVTETPWTMGDIMQRWTEMGEEAEKDVRELLTEDIFKAVVKAQLAFFHEREHPMEERAMGVAEISMLLLQKVLSSDEEISNTYPAFEPEEVYWSAELLEVIRRTILKPSQCLLEGYGRSGINSVPGYDDQGWWEERVKLITPEMTKAKDKSEYDRLEQERQQKAINERLEKDWEQLLPEEENYILGYLKESVERLAESKSQVVSFAQRATYQGKRLATDEALRELQTDADRITEIKKNFDKIKNFEDVLPWIKETFGKEATFQTFIDFLIPNK